MWKRMLRADVALATLLSLALTWPICWVLVYKFGWRYTDWFGLNERPLGDNESFMFYLVLSNMMLACLGAPILALRRIAMRGVEAPAASTGE